MRSLVLSVTLALIVVGLFYFGCIVISGFKSLRRLNAAASPQSCPPQLRVFFLVPCLNEEAVIGATVSALAALKPEAIVVIDDGSDDRTAETALTAGGGRVVLCSRHLPDARVGKGAALNAGLELVRSRVVRAGWHPADVIVAVMDADGRLSSGALDAVLPLFVDPTVGAVQLAVRIRNRDRFLPRIQDWEFWGLAALSQYARQAAGTVSLGGNGQFTRLLALRSLEGPAWSDSLTEDLDLALRLTALEWRLTTTSDAYVDQQGLTSVRALARQRTRWFQGHLACARHIPALARAPGLSGFAFQELVLYLLFPLVIMMPWSLVWAFALPATMHLLSAHRPALVAHSALATQVAIIGAWYLFSFAPTIVAGAAYRRRDPSCGRAKAQLLAHVAFLLQPFYWWCCWRAAFRLVRGAHQWDKTPRLTEVGSIVGDHGSRGSGSSPGTPAYLNMDIRQRPEAIEIAPVVHLLRAARDFEPIVVATAQHREMIDQVLETFVTVPDSISTFSWSATADTGATVRPMILSDRSIREELVAGRIVIDPLDEGCIQPSSVDLHIDRYFRVFLNHTMGNIDVKKDMEELTELVEIQEDDMFILHPGEFVLGSTSERVALPDDLVARLEGKSSLGRLGLLIHSTAGFVDAGWDGHLTLELSNVANLPITLYPGMKIGQISFLRMTTPADQPYGSKGVGSKYQGQRGPTPSRYFENFRGDR